MYTTISKAEVINIIEMNDPEITETNQKEIINILKALIEQNYFQFNQEYYKQTEGFAMGAPASLHQPKYTSNIWSISNCTQS
jgi:hypothetical protein